MIQQKDAAPASKLSFKSKELRTSLSLSPCGAPIIWRGTWIVQKQHGKTSRIIGEASPEITVSDIVGLPHGEIHAENLTPINHLTQSELNHKPLRIERGPQSLQRWGQSSGLPLIKDSQAKANLSELLLQCATTLKLYGKQPEALGDITAMFVMVLGEYCFEDIMRAFAFYLNKIGNDMPAPFDIANIIDRGFKPPFDRSVYVSLSRKEAQHRTKDEWEYMRQYEHFAVTGHY